MGELESLYLSMRGGIASLVSRIVPPDDVEDIIQETYLRLIRVAMVDEIRNPRAYIYRVARNLALDSIKKADNAWTISFEEDFHEAGARTDDVVRQAQSREEFAVFCAAVRHLPRQARRVFVLKKVHGLTQRQIAVDLGISESTVEKHVALAVRRCARYMRRYEYEASEDQIRNAQPASLNSR